MIKPIRSRHGGRPAVFHPRGSFLFRGHAQGLVVSGNGAWTHLSKRERGRYGACSGLLQTSQRTTNTTRNQFPRGVAACPEQEENVSISPRKPNRNPASKSVSLLPSPYQEPRRYYGPGLSRKETSPCLIKATAVESSNSRPQR
jgi:hypothetical protein